MWKSFPRSQYPIFQNQYPNTQYPNIKSPTVWSPIHWCAFAPPPCPPLPRSSPLSRCGTWWLVNIVWYDEWHQKRKVGLEAALLRLQMRRSWLPSLMNTSCTLLPPLTTFSSSFSFSLLPPPGSLAHTICPALSWSSQPRPPIFPVSTFTSANASEFGRIKSS